MEKRTSLMFAVAVTLIGLSVALCALMSNAPILPTMAQPINTPAAPVQVQSPVSKLPPSAVVSEPLGQTQSDESVTDQPILDPARLQRMSDYAQAVRQAGTRFTAIDAAGHASPLAPQSPSDTCMTMLGNPQMDILKTGDTTGTIDSWVILYHKVYYDDDPGNYNSPYYSLVMVDQPIEYDPSISETLDYDAFGQEFLSPANLTSVTINYSRLYTNANVSDTAGYSLWTVDSQGDRDWVVGYYIGESPSGWSNRQMVITDSAVLAALSGKTLMLIFDLATDRQVPGEWIWLDDAQVTVCYASGPTKVYLPVVTKQPPPSTTPACTPYEPDNRDTRGYTMVGATCYGAFNPSDDKDYYTLNLGGVANVRLQLANLPAGSNYDALIYEYPYTGQQPACYIGTPGDQNKSANCPPLDLGKTYFAFVNAGGPPSGPKTYEMSVINPAGASGIYGQVKYNGSPVAGIYLVLRFYNGSTWSNWGSPVATDGSGNYRFTGMPSLGSGQKYYVRYANNANGNPLNTNYLAWWGSFEITSYSAGSNVAGGNFDIADVTLASPAGGSTVTLPRTFTWNPRSATPSDSYEFDLFDPADHSPWAYSNLLGYAGSFGVGSLPSGFSYGTQYCWDVWVYAGNTYTNGSGESLYCRYIRFSTTAQGTEVTVNGQELNQFKTEDADHKPSVPSQMR